MLSRSVCHIRNLGLALTGVLASMGGLTVTMAQEPDQAALTEVSLAFIKDGASPTSQTPVLDYASGEVVLQVRWASSFQRRDNVQHRVWVRHEHQDWKSANMLRMTDPSGVDGWCQFAYTPHINAGDSRGVRLKLSVGYRPEGWEGFPREDGQFDTLPEAMPLPSGTHRFTLGVQRVVDGRPQSPVTQDFDIIVRDTPHRPAVDGIAAHQVFQRRTKQAGEIELYICDLTPGESVQVGVESGDAPIRRARLTAQRAVERFVVPDVPVGGPYRVRVAVGDRQAVHEPVYVGDLWIIGGQSNAVGASHDMTGARQAMPGVSGLTPRYGRLQWRPASDGFFESTMGPWITAAQEFYEATGVPVGLMGHAVGAQAMDYFLTPSQRDLYFLKPIVEQHGRGAAAFFWYQGESDAFSPARVEAYGDKLDILAQAMGRYTGNGELAIGIVQLGRYLWHRDDHFADLRETQRRFVLRTPGSALFATLPYPVNEKDKIHLTTPGYIALGHQVAASMIEREQGGVLTTPGPTVQQVRFADAAYRRIIVQFDNARGLCAGEGDPMEQWYVTDEARRGFGKGGFVPLAAVHLDAQAQQVVLELAESPGGSAAVSYGYRCDVGGTLVNGAGFPAAGFVKMEAVAE